MFSEFFCSWNCLDLYFPDRMNWVISQISWKSHVLCISLRHTGLTEFASLEAVSSTFEATDSLGILVLLTIIAVT